MKEKTEKIIEAVEMDKLANEQQIIDNVKKIQDKKLEDEKEKEDLVIEYYIGETSEEEELENTKILLNAA